jgi:hypothetical protein
MGCRWIGRGRLKAATRVAAPQNRLSLLCFDRFPLLKMTRPLFTSTTRILLNYLFLLSICCYRPDCYIVVDGFLLPRSTTDAIVVKTIREFGPRIEDENLLVRCWWSGRRSFLLHQSTATETDQDAKRTSSTIQNNHMTDEYDEGLEAVDDQLDMPWSDMQAWALRDELPKYTVQVSVVTRPDGKETIKRYSLWRTMIQEVTELSGYPLPFVLQKYTAMRERKSDETTTTTTTSICQTSCEILPFLDQFEFEPNGGLSGRVYGVAGVADGARIQTTPVKNIQTTIPKGFVQTQDGAVIYELGTPAFSEGTKNRMSEMPANGGRLSTTVANTMASASLSELPKVDGDLLKLTALTAAVIGGATLVASLSHHLTVSVFWV